MADVAVTSINIQPKDINLSVGEKYTIKPVIKPARATNKKVIFDSSDKSIATVNESGEVAAFIEGLAVVTAVTDDGGFTDSVKVKVEGKPVVMEPVVMEEVEVTGVSVAPDSVSLKVGASQQLTATVEPEDATDKSVSWSVDDDNVALVDSSGLVEATAEGEAVVTVTTVDGGFADTSSVSVEAVPVVDLSQLSNEHWPSNYVFRKSSIYLDIEEITLATNQSARLLQTPEGFVLERIDLAVIKPAAMDLSLKFVVDSGDIAQFAIDAGSTVVERTATDGAQPGDYLPETWINLVNLGDKPEGEGRLAMSFIGYLIEPWR